MEAERGRRLPDESLPLLICLFGTFRVLKAGVPVPMRTGGKMEAVLAGIALHERFHARRETLLELLWPEQEAQRAARSLHTLLHALRRLLGDALRGQPPIVRVDGGYQLNVGAGVTVDTAHFDALVGQGEDCWRRGDIATAVRHFERAVSLYQGDLCVGGDVRALIERERLRGQYLSLLAHLADVCFQELAYRATIGYAQRLLLHDPCREDAHRMLMRCHVRLGERSQAMQHYRLCREILRREFDAEPEPATEALFSRVRLEPEDV